MNGRRSQQLPVVAPLKPLPRRSAVPVIREVGVKPRNNRRKSLVDLPEKREKYRELIADLIEPLRKDYLELVKAYKTLPPLTQAREEDEHVKDLSVIDDKVEQCIDDMINQYFCFVRRVPIKNNRLFSLPNELLLEILLYLDLQSLFCITLLSSSLFFESQKKKIKFDTVKVTCVVYGVRVIEVIRGMDSYTLQVVPELDWRARADKTLRRPPKDLKRISNGSLSIPARPSLSCLLKNLIPAKTVRRLVVKPRDKDLIDEMAFFNQLFESAVFFESEELFAVLPCRLSQETLDKIVADCRNHLEVKFPYSRYHSHEYVLTTPSSQKHINWYVKLELKDCEATLQCVTEFPVEKAWNMFERWTVLSADVVKMRDKGEYVSEFFFLKNSDDYSTMEKRITTYCRRNGYHIEKNGDDGNTVITKDEDVREMRERYNRILAFVYNEQLQRFCCDEIRT